MLIDIHSLTRYGSDLYYVFSLKVGRYTHLCQKHFYYGFSSMLFHVLLDCIYDMRFMSITLRVHHSRKALTTLLKKGYLKKVLYLW